MDNQAVNGIHHIDALHEAAEAGGLEEDIGTFLFSSESVGEGHPGECEMKQPVCIIYSNFLTFIGVVNSNLGDSNNNNNAD